MKNNFKVIKPLIYGSIFTIVVLLGLLLFSVVAKGQSQYLPKIAWRTEAKNVTMLTDSTYRVDVYPLNINEPGVFIKGDYFKDFVGHTYQVIDSTFNTIDIWDCFNVGVGPQLDKEGVIYKSIDGAPYLAPIPYLHLNETALEYSRAIELAVLWKQANLYAQDSSYLVWWNDTIQDIATKYDLDTLNQKTLDSLLIHRTEIDQLKNQSDIPRFATITEAIAGNDSTTIMSPRTNRDSDTLLYVPFYGAAENVYSDKNATFDTLRSQAMQGDTVRLVFVNNEGTLFDSLIHIGASDIVLNLADILEAQAGINDSIMTALRTAEQLTLNAVSYYNVKEDIYSNFDATFDSIFASNLYQENVSVDAIGTAGVYDKEVETNNIEVFLNGVLQRENVHYTQTETQITFIMTPLADDYVTIKYKQ